MAMFDVESDTDRLVKVLSDIAYELQDLKTAVALSVWKDTVAHSSDAAKLTNAKEQIRLALMPILEDIINVDK